MRRLIGRLLLCCLIGAAPSLASAHAVLLGSLPEAKQQLDAAPTEIVLEFNENVGPVFFKVVDREGKDVGRPGDIRLDGNDVRLPLGEALANGTYIVTYRVISADTHPVGGSYLFAVGEPLAALDTTTVAAPTARSPWWIAVAINRAVHYAAVLLALGSALFLLWMRLPASAVVATRSQGRWAAIVAALAFPLAIGLGGAEMIAGGASAFLAPAAWSMGATSTLGASALLGVPGALLLVFAFSRAREGVWLWAGTALLVASFLVTGHAATAPPVWLMATSVAVHLVCGGFWFAALMPLLRAVRSDDRPVAASLLVQFSTRAIWTVSALFVSGLVMSVVQVRAFDQLWTSDYGARLAIKIALFLVLLALAALNKVAFTPAVARAEPAAVGRLRGSMRIEYGLMLAIVLAAASLTVVIPPRAMLAQGAAQAGMDANGDAGFRTSVQRDPYTIDVEVTPAKPGENMIMLTFKDASGEPFDMQSSRIELSLPAASIEGIQVQGEAMPPGMYHFMVGEMIVPGEWQMRVEAFVDDFDKLVVNVPVPVR